MKKLKFLAMLLMAAVVSLSMAACSSDNDENELDPEEVSIGVSGLTDTGSELSWTATESFNYGGRTYTQKITYHYGYSGETITSHRDVMEFSDSDIAEEAKEDLEDDKDVEKVTQNGRTVTVVYKPSDYANLTTTIVRNMYEIMKGYNKK